MHDLLTGRHMVLVQMYNDDADAAADKNDGAEAGSESSSDAPAGTQPAS